MILGEKGFTWLYAAAIVGQSYGKMAYATCLVLRRSNGQRLTNLFPLEPPPLNRRDPTVNGSAGRLRREKERGKMKVAKSRVWQPLKKKRS
ncbi:unnamed protein product [Sphenostylis stenocarpa]|uniref:Uncharacterized protein n=1 Tax=Sphenostylis stenocarpa TaxID=92480 RepID=A0AA86TR03_9FABA|nr:unnamed protein product [Sphenostylis stenocarpa]